MDKGFRLEIGLGGRESGVRRQDPRLSLSPPRQRVSQAPCLPLVKWGGGVVPILATEAKPVGRIPRYSDWRVEKLGWERRKG